MMLPRTDFATMFRPASQNPVFCLTTLLALSFFASALLADEALFHEQVAPLLERRCLGCHNDKEKKGGLSLETATAAFTGGDSGVVIAPGKPAESSLLDLIDPKNGTAAMPKDSDPLQDSEIATIKRWIVSGANWPEQFRLKPARVSSTDWWSLRPIRQPEIPVVADADRAWIATPIDAFIITELRRRDLAPSSSADKATLVRRVYFDLVGLPPSPEEIERFVADDRPRAYEELVDRLLDSPAYGERWARHWLDVVHYGETHGYDKDKPRMASWPYRDYVIRSLNADKPYGRFIEEQIAGDTLYPNTRDGIEALGFLAAGPWDFIGHAEVPESKLDGKVARHLDRDDMVTNTLQSFCSLTVQCAQCHNHKFDPILQTDYYQLQAVFAAIDRTERRYDADAATARQRGELAARQATASKQLTELRQSSEARAGKAYADLQAKVIVLEAIAKGPTYPPEHGYHSGIAAAANTTKWVQLNLAKPAALETIVLHACHDDFNNVGDGFGFPLRYKIEASDDPTFATAVQMLSDHTEQNVDNPKLAAVTIAAGGKTAKHIRLTATQLAPRLATDFIFSLAEIEVLDAAGNNLAKQAEVVALDSVDAPPRWQRSNLIDGIYPADPHSDELTRLKSQAAALLATATTPDEKKLQADLQNQIAAVSKEVATLPPQQVCYVGAVHTGDGNFVGTGGQAGKPRPIYVLNRGNVAQPGQKVGPGALSQFTSFPQFADLPADHTEADRRAALAHWISSKQNALTWRSIVNRVWQHHFGRGLVDTPNDFGRNGKLPSHPELLDWLAAEFRDHGQSLKSLHRLMLLSNTYRQASSPATPVDIAAHDQALEIDGENHWLWHMPRRKLEAEVIRDAMLQLSGTLNATMYGPSFQDFVIEKPEHSPHYEYQLYDPSDAKSHRRSIYRFLVRSQPQPFMTALDCADPSMQVDKRNESLSATQALALLNNDFVVVMVKQFAQRMEAWPGEMPKKVDRAFYEAVGRTPTAAEQEQLLKFARQHGLANFCRVLMNLNAFVFVD